MLVGKPWGNFLNAEVLLMFLNSENILSKTRGWIDFKLTMSSICLYSISISKLITI